MDELRKECSHAITNCGVFSSRPLFLGDPNIEILDKGQILHIKNARRIDKGRYQCSAANSAGKQIKELKLIIHGRGLK